MSNNIIFGIQKLSLVDFPKYPSFVLFLGGCNFACPFCHNESIVRKKESVYDTEEVFELIKIRKGFIDGVVVTGGEPTIYGEKLITLLKRIKSFGLKIKLDTNGTNPELLKKIINENLIDYIAMDIKNTFDKYNEAAGVKVSIDHIKQSIKLIEKSNISYEFRTTINKTMHTKADILEIKSYFLDPSHWFLQPYKYNEHQLIKQNFYEFDKNEMKEFEDILKIEQIRI